VQWQARPPSQQLNRYATASRFVPTRSPHAPGSVDQRGLNLVWASAARSRPVIEPERSAIERRLPGDDSHRADFGLHRAARNGWILREHRLDLRPLAQIEHADAERIVANPGWPRDDKLSFVVQLPEVSPVRLEHLPLFFDPVSGWSKDDEEAHASGEWC